jgi:two-component system, OmpR family, KDP operon response regulator KdpE
MSRVLVVDDELPIRRALIANLQARGYDVDAAATGEEALHLAAAKHPDLVLLDLGLPKMDGLSVIAGLRGWTTVPIVVLSAREQESEKVAALDAGADDYVTKPFGMDELMARIRVALRRQHPPAETPLVETPHFRLDLADRTALRLDGSPTALEVKLTPTEWSMVEFLVRNPGRLVTQRQLLQHIWNSPVEIDTNLLRVHMTHIRRKLEPDPSRPQYFMTEPRMGYRFIEVRRAV